MITFQEARQIAETEINKYQILGDDLLVIVDDQIIEKNYAWIFPYTSKKFWETNDVKYAIAGNGPLFISKLDGQITKYRTVLSVEGMIDEYEKDHKIWRLTLTCDIFTDTIKTSAFRNILGLTIPEIADLRKNTGTPFEIGSKTRLAEIQNQLSLEDIATSLTQRALIDKTEI
ncbi:MAG: YrhB domain-containing protein [Ferruginibacter sp.]